MQPVWDAMDMTVGNALTPPRSSERKLAITNGFIVTKEGFELVGRYIHDLCENGCFVASKGDFYPGEEVILSVRSPVMEHWIDLEGHIVRYCQAARFEDHIRGYGIYFRPLDRISRSLLLASLERLPNPDRRVRSHAFPEMNRRTYFSDFVGEDMSYTLHHDYARALTQLADPSAT